jgi:hypothetical protein
MTILKFKGTIIQFAGRFDNGLNYLHAGFDAVSADAELVKLCAAVRIYENPRYKQRGGVMRIPHPKTPLIPRLAKARIELHSTFFDPIALEETPSLKNDLKQTFLHEFAHLIDFATNFNANKTPHGYRWRNIMHAMGIPAKRCYNPKVVPLKFYKERPVRNLTFELATEIQAISMGASKYNAKSR